MNTTSPFWTDKGLETARAVVKRCGIRDGLFKGPRTLNAVEMVALALATVRREVWNEAFKVQCCGCAEGDEPIYSKEARWFYHGISNQEVGCSASKLRIAALSVLLLIVKEKMMADKRSCGHVWRNNGFDCIQCLEERIRRLENGLRQVLEGRFRYNMGDYEMCAKNAARLALGDD